MANYNTIHVYPDGNVWIVKKGNAARASAIRNTQREAYIAAREIALNQGLSVTVHGADGKIQKVINPQDRSSDNCFITSACISAKELPDDCYELKTLRRFRDSYVHSLSNGSELIEKYYSVGPEIVKAIEGNSARIEIYDSIFQRITKACILIEQNKLEEAFIIYSDTVRNLSTEFELI